MAEMGAADSLITDGVTFNNVRAFLAFMYFGVDGMTDEQWKNALRHVVPLQHNFESPLVAGKREQWNPKDTYIQYWIDEDDRITQDGRDLRFAADDDLLPENVTPIQTSECMKAARVTVRFVGADAEAWAKLMHHITRRRDVPILLLEYCNAAFLEYPGPIRPINVDYFGVANSAIAFDITFVLQYNEVIRVPGDQLGLIAVADGDIELTQQGRSE